MAKCLILGANGFVGSHLVDAIIQNGHDVRAFDRFSKGKYNFVEHERIEVITGDYLNSFDLERAIEGVDYVFHFISTTTPATAENDPLIDIETNVKKSVELFQLCVDKNVKRVLFASTGGAIYGDGGDKPHAETDTPLPVSPYAIGKLSIEHYLRYFKTKHGLDSIAFRISNPYGERQPLHRKQGVIPIFLENIISGKQLTVLGDGTMVRDYIYVKDVAHMIASMFDKPATSSLYNIGSGAGVTVSELVSLVESATGLTADIQSLPTPATFVHKVTLDTSLFTNEFHVTPSTALEDGLLATAEYVKAELEK